MLHSASPIVVQKYGGSSVADPDKIRKVAKQVALTARAGKSVVVVVSAMGKTTDGLLDLAHQITTSPQRRELDMLLSTGERISMALLAMALHEQGMDAISFTGSQSGIITTDRHSGARIIEVRPIRIQEALQQNKVVIVAGFQGMSYKREITTLGRGGSDTTAVALAAALGAQSCEIYSDVDGVYSADPRMVDNARHLPEISYDEMQALAEHGAKVLNAQAVAWAKQAGVVIHARKTGHVPGDTETHVLGSVDFSSRHGLKASAVTATPRIVKMAWEKRGWAALQALGEQGIFIRNSHWQQGPEGGSLQISLVKDDLPDWESLLQTFRKNGFCGEPDETLGTVTVVGAGLGNHSTALFQLVDSLQKQDIQVHSSESSALYWNITVPAEYVHPATQCIHRQLIENKNE